MACSEIVYNLTCMLWNPIFLRTSPFSLEKPAHAPVYVLLCPVSDVESRLFEWKYNLPVSSSRLLSRSLDKILKNIVTLLKMMTTTTTLWATEAWVFDDKYYTNKDGAHIVNHVLKWEKENKMNENTFGYLHRKLLHISFPFSYRTTGIWHHDRWFASC